MFEDEIATGLQVWMDVDAGHNEDWWAVTLAKSVLSVDGATLPDPNPGHQVPEPATMLLFGFGLAGLAGFNKRFK